MKLYNYELSCIQNCWNLCKVKYIKYISFSTEWLHPKGISYSKVRLAVRLFEGRRLFPIDSYSCSWQPTTLTYPSKHGASIIYMYLYNFPNVISTYVPSGWTWDWVKLTCTSFICTYRYVIGTISMLWASRKQGLF